MLKVKNYCRGRKNNISAKFPARKMKENCREISAEEMVASTDGKGRILPDPSNKMPYSDYPPSEDTHLLSKPSLIYIALIATVILASPSHKLNLASIYRAMEEQFPYLRSRGPGWRNSVRHSLSVNDCFVKVSRCEDGRGHYWGVHQALQNDFQQGNFGRYRRARGRRKRERRDEAWSPTWIRTSCLLRRFYETSSLACVEPCCPLQEPHRYQSLLGWTQPHYQPWRVNAGWIQSTSWMNQPDSYRRPSAGRGCISPPTTSRLCCWHENDSVLPGMKESYDSRLMTPQIQAVRFPICWCVSPVMRE